ncbi:MAG: hypothetical protein MK052_02330 [Alphaproteobacteria bacterium]|nr:hypothetical protein [Alphaproteobacteria bacterium]
MDKPSPEKSDPSAKQQKPPGAVMRFAIRAQAVVNLATAMVMPVITAMGIKKGNISIPLPYGKKDIALDTTEKKVAAGAIGVVTAAYSGINAISRIRTAKDAAIQEQIAAGEIEPSEAHLNSKEFDVAMTRVNAGISGATAVATGVFAARSLATPSLNADEKTTRVVGALGAMGAAAVMGKSKLEAAKAAQENLEAQKAQTMGRAQEQLSGYVERIENEREDLAHTPATQRN